MVYHYLDELSSSGCSQPFLAYAAISSPFETITASSRKFSDTMKSLSITFLNNIDLSDSYLLTTCLYNTTIPCRYLFNPINFKNVCNKYVVSVKKPHILYFFYKGTTFLFNLQMIFDKLLNIFIRTHPFISNHFTTSQIDFN